MPKIKEITLRVPEGYIAIALTPGELVVILNAITLASQSVSNYESDTIERLLKAYEPILGILGIEFDGADYILSEEGNQDVPTDEVIINRIKRAMETVGVRHEQLA